MSLTNAQLLLLKADLLAVRPSLPSNWGAEELANFYNLPIEPPHYVWKTAVSPTDWAQAIIGGGGATQLDALSASKRDSLLWACGQTLNASLPAARAALEDFCGTQNNLKAAIKAASYRLATRAEKVLATGTGSTNSPGTMGWEGRLTYVDIEDALEAV